MSYVAGELESVLSLLWTPEDAMWLQPAVQMSRLRLQCQKLLQRQQTMQSICWPGPCLQWCQGEARPQQLASAEVSHHLASYVTALQIVTMPGHNCRQGGAALIARV